MRMRPMLWMIALIVLFGSATTLLRTAKWSLFGSGTSAQPPAASTSQIPVVSHRSNSTRQPTVIKPPPANARDQRLEATRLLGEAEEAQREALDHIRTWETEIAPIREDESGDAVAANEDLVNKLVDVFSEPRMSEAKLKIVGDEIGRLKSRVETLETKNGTEFLSAREMFDISDLHTTANAARRSWADAVRRANAIVLKAKLVVNPVAEPTLGLKMGEIEADRTLDAMEAADTAEPATGLPMDEPAYFVDPELLAAALSTEVKSTLAPFLEPRTVQPSLSGPSVKFVKTYEEKPMSLGKITSMGALDESVVGLMRLAAIAGNRKLPEPNWSISAQPNNWKEGDEDLLKRAQSMLREYGNILVSRGLLSP